MSEHEELHRLIGQLREELEWAARTGIEPPDFSGAETAAAPAIADQEPAAAAPVKAAPTRTPTPAKPAPSSPPAKSAIPFGGEEPPLPDEPPPNVDALLSLPAEMSPAVPKNALPVVQAELDACASLEAIRDLLTEDCQLCKLAKQGRKQIVFGVGNPDAQVMFVGEGPGGDEDRIGEPFVGKAGQLLTKIIEGGMGLARSDVYIANIVKCRPPKNRDPEPDEVERCRPFLEAQIRVVKPAVIITLGRYASQTLLGTKTGMTRLRGNWGDYQGVPVMPTFHPAYLLRNAAGKRPVWEDIQAVLKKLGKDIPSKGNQS